MKPSEIRKILKVAKDLGVKELSYDGLTVQFFDKRTKQTRVDRSHPTQPDPTAIAPSTPPTKSPPDLTSEMMPTEDELLLMSTPFYDQMQMMKRLKDSDAEESTLTQ